MLADEITHAVGTYQDKMADGGIGEFAKAVAASQRFVFGADASAAAGQVAKSNVASLVQALPLSRSSFQTQWMEWSPFEMGDTDPNAGVKMGVLIECLDDSGTRFDCTLCWLMRRGQQPIVWPVGLSVDLRSSVEGERLLGYDFAAASDQSSEDPKERQALKELTRHLRPSLSRFCGNLHHKMMIKQGIAFEETIHSWMAMAMRQTRHLLSALCLLNSRNFISTQQVDLTRLNKAHKRSGKTELLIYSEVHIGLSKREKAVAAAVRLTSAEIKRHVVRGHFKVKKGGIYWWRPFLRGSAAAGTVVRTGYVVGSRPELATVGHAPC